MEARVRSIKSMRSSADRDADARPDRRQAILLVAEKLFAQHGYHAVTIRQIAIEAEVPLALVGYYYGQKHELFEAIFEHWSPTIDERLTGLKAAVDAGGPDLLRHIVEAFVQPVLRMRASAEGEFYALLVARELSYASPEADRVLRRHFDPLAHAYIDALQAALAHISVGDAAWAYQFALGALLAPHERPARGAPVARRQYAQRRDIAPDAGALHRRRHPRRVARPVIARGATPRFFLRRATNLRQP